MGHRESVRSKMTAVPKTFEQLAHELLVERGVLNVYLDDLAGGVPGALQDVSDQLAVLTELLEELRPFACFAKD